MKRESYDLNAHPWWENNGLGIISCWLFPFSFIFYFSCTSLSILSSRLRVTWKTSRGRCSRNRRVPIYYTYLSTFERRMNARAGCCQPDLVLAPIASRSRRRPFCFFLAPGEEEEENDRHFLLSVVVHLIERLVVLYLRHSRLQILFFKVVASDSSTCDVTFSPKIK